MLKLMSFNVCSIRSWKFKDNQPISKKWLDYFSEIIKTNDSNIIFLQEVKTKNNEISYLCNSLGSEWCVFDTSTIANCKDNLNNAILFKNELNCKEVTKKYNTYQNCNNNLQIIEFKHKDKYFIGINTHLKSDKDGKNQYLYGFHGD